MITQNIASLDGLGYEAIHSSMSQNIFSYLKIFCMQCRKNTVEDSQKGMNITNLYMYIEIYIQVHIPILYVTKIIQNKTDSINSCY